jgi:hypothetical protein
LTSDEVNLRINKWPLIRVSQIFEDLFTIPHPNNSLEEPVVQIAETAETMIDLLKFLYPDWDDPQITTVYTMRNLLAATDKYDILRIRRLLIEIACSDAFVNQFPVDCYTLALRYDSSRLKQISLHVLKGINLIGNQDIDRVLRDAYLFGIEYFDLLVAHGRRSHCSHSSYPAEFFVFCRRPYFPTNRQLWP